MSAFSLTQGSPFKLGSAASLAPGAVFPHPWAARSSSKHLDLAQLDSSAASALESSAASLSAAQLRETARLVASAQLRAASGCAVHITVRVLPAGALGTHEGVAGVPPAKVSYKSKEESFEMKREQPVHKEEMPQSKEESFEMKHEAPVHKEEMPQSKEESFEMKREQPVHKEEMPQSKEESFEMKHEAPVHKEEMPQSKEESLEMKHEEPVPKEERHESIEKRYESVEERHESTQERYESEEARHESQQERHESKEEEPVSKEERYESTEERHESTEGRESKEVGHESKEETLERQEGTGAIAGEGTASSDAIRIGSRVSTAYGDLGTVRYRGSTHFKEGEWVGVELDKPKGKNDGEVRGVRYFSCRAHYGLFTKASNLKLVDPSPQPEADVVPSLESPRSRVPRHSLATTSAARESKPMRQRALSMPHECESSPFPPFQIPEGWEEVWLDGAVPTGKPRLDLLPVQLYVSSVGGDRKTTRDCRYAMDFLLSKRVPHAIHDLSAKPELRRALGLSTASPATKWSAEGEVVLPRIQLREGLVVGLSALQDMEDHAELDPILAPVIREYARRLGHRR